MCGEWNWLRESQWLRAYFLLLLLGLVILEDHTDCEVHHVVVAKFIAGYWLDKISIEGNPALASKVSTFEWISLL